jgi:hypothetical protein
MRWEVFESYYGEAKTWHDNFSDDGGETGIRTGHLPMLSLLYDLNLEG